jgi:site-specific recombinase XerC
MRAFFSNVIERYRQEKAQPADIRDGKNISGLKSHYNFGKMLDVLVEHFSQTRLCDLKSADLHAYKRQRLTTPTRRGTVRSVAAVNRELEALRSVCRWCVAQGWISRSPFEYGEPVINKSHEASRDRVLLYDEEERLLAVCTGRSRRRRC